MFVCLHKGKIVAIDPSGNTLSKTKAGVTTEFKYDIRDQLGEVLQGTSILGRYGYDYNRRRILKLGDDGIRRYSYDQLSVVTEANEANATVSKYDYGLDQLVSLDNTVEGRSFCHLDILRSTVSLSDAAGSTRQSIFYDAWGNERDRVGSSANKFTFTGHEKDEETGLIYAKASPAPRFVSRRCWERTESPSIRVRQCQPCEVRRPYRASIRRGRRRWLAPSSNRRVLDQ